MSQKDHDLKTAAGLGKGGQPTRPQTYNNQIRIFTYTILASTIGSITDHPLFYIT